MQLSLTGSHTEEPVEMTAASSRPAERKAFWPSDDVEWEVLERAQRG